jgi:hypothetical protein
MTNGSTAISRPLIRFYQRRLTQYTPPCPRTPCCSDYALEHGIRAALARMRTPVAGKIGWEYTFSDFADAWRKRARGSS